MPDDKNVTGRRTRDWSKRLGVTRVESKKAVQQVGTSAEAVSRKHLGR
jgi:hypothetical protein